MEINQYKIVLVDLDYGISEKQSGAEIRKTRPCVVISPDEMNPYLRNIVLAPMTSRSGTYPSRVRVRHRQKTGWIVLDQIRTVDRKRVLSTIGKLSNREIFKLKDVMREIYVD